MVLIIVSFHYFILLLIEYVYFIVKKKSCPSSSLVTRVALSTREHRKKDGNHVNSQVAETLVWLQMFQT